MISRIAATIAVLAFSASFAAAQQPAAKSLKMQATWPTAVTAWDNFQFLAERIDKLTAGSLKIETLPAGQVVPAFETLDAVNRKVLDGGHSIAYFWSGKNKAAVLFTGGPGGPYGMDMIDFIGWMYEGGGWNLYQEFYTEVIKMNVIGFPTIPTTPQAFGWFKRPIKNLADLKGMKCRQTGITAEVFQKMGMSTVNLPPGEIIPAAQRGVIDCAEYVGGMDDLKLGFPMVWKYHYTPGMHESTSTGEVIFNLDVWKALTSQQQEAVRSAANESFSRWWAKWQKGQAEAMKEMREKHGVQILRTPPDILIAFLKAWDQVAAEESAKNPFFKKVLESQKAYASLVVPAKRFLFPPYSFAANYYWPEAKPAAASAKGPKK
ncbi:MAG TPA: TRAP transporter substrate-binding protein [Burkholderiales bacterium]|nr:TRAP transporter substrate-binding protein [Burkholderiales bacterium]